MSEKQLDSTRRVCTYLRISTEHEAQSRFLPVKSMEELYSTAYNPNNAIVEGLLASKCVLLSGAPKSGKSFLVLQLAYHVSTGTPIWGLQVQKGTVLYLSLEDDHERLQQRLYRMFGTEVADDLYISTVAKQLGAGLEDQLQGFVKDHPGTKLIIIDTLQKVRELGNGRYSYASDYVIIGDIKALATRLGVCILVVHHTRKQQADDPFDMISGTQGLLGAADGAMILQKEKRTDRHAILDSVGRDFQDQRIHLTRNMETLCWELDRIETELWWEPPNPILDAVAGLVTPDHPVWKGTASDLVEALGLEMKPNKISYHLNVNRQRLTSEYGINYEKSRTQITRSITLTLATAD